MFNLDHNYDWKHHFELSQAIYSYLEEANPLPNPDKIEALSRSIIHLAYYSCFNITKIKNEKYDKKPIKRGHSSHIETIEQIRGYHDTGLTRKELSDIVADLRMLRDYRTAADYQGTTKIGYYDVKNEIVDLASDVFDKLNTL